MKKIFLYTMLACMAVSFGSCSDDPMDATEKHVYGENENPYLRTDASATIAYTAEFREGHIASQTISLTDYAEVIQTKLGMTVDDLLSALESGKAVFYNINTARGQWNKTAPTKGSTGWYYDADGLICEQASGVASIELDKSKKALVVEVPDNSTAGLSIAENVGFAINNGKNYDDYVRFNIPISVTNPGLIIASLELSNEAFTPSLVDFTKSQESIEKCLGISFSQFLKDIHDVNGPIAMYMVNNETGEWDTTSSYTANGLGYWVTDKYQVCNWGTDGISYYAETDTSNKGVNIGHIGVASGTKFELNFVYAMKDDPQNKFIQFKVTAIVK